MEMPTISDSYTRVTDALDATSVIALRTEGLKNADIARRLGVKQADVYHFFKYHADLADYTKLQHYAELMADPRIKDILNGAAVRLVTPEADDRAATMCERYSSGWSLRDLVTGGLAKNFHDARNTLLAAGIELRASVGGKQKKAA